MRAVNHKRVARRDHDLEFGVERIVTRRLHEIRVRIGEAGAERARCRDDERRGRRLTNKMLELVHQFCRLAEALVRLRSGSLS